jgi:S1-C subfamily serine protease
VPGTGTFWGQILPNSILGFATLLFFMSIAAAFSGAALFAFYRFELDDTKERIAQVESEIADDVAASEQVIEEREEEALAEIEGLLAELEQFAASGQTIDELVEGVKDSVYLVTTRDVNGQPSVATAFVLFSDSERSYLLTSFKAIEAATVDPGPSVEVRGGAGQLAIELASWDPERDLALLVAEENPNLPAIEVAEPSSVGTGDRLFAVSALGGQGASIVQGVVADTSADGIQHDVPMGIQFRGGPMLDSSGKLVAIGSRDYAPLPFSPEAVFFGIPVRKACDEVVQCPTSLTG